MKEFKANLWIRIALINFVLVAVAGVVMRYKSIYSLPGVDQKYLMHGHSHFAFVGWITLTLMCLMVQLLAKNQVQTNYRKYNLMLLINLLTAYGMLITFILEGYALASILFSNATILLSYLFIYYYWKDLNRIQGKTPYKCWLKTALVLWAFSSIGAFMLAYLMAAHHTNQKLYFMAIYLFLHFQYNGWFLFAAFGILMFCVATYLSPPALQLNQRLFTVMAITVAPAYFLSILWLRVPPVIVWVAKITGIIQLIALFLLVALLRHLQKTKIRLSKTTIWLWRLAAFAFLLKLILQFCSALPAFRIYAFGLRPIVIGYLHLCFIGIFSLFLLGYINEYMINRLDKINNGGLWLFILGFAGQEIILLLQGLAVIDGFIVESAAHILFYAAILMAVGLLWLAGTLIPQISDA